MKPAAMLAALAAALFALPTLRAETAEPAKAAALLGDWWTPGFGARVRVEPCGDAVCGRIVWAWDETPPDVADKSPLVGRKVMAGMRAAEAGHWNGGRLYNPEDGRDYQGALHLQSTSRLVVEGCALFVCRKQVWRRVEEGRCPPVDRADLPR